MDKLTQFALQNGRLTWLLIILLIAGGSTTYLTQPRQEDPELIPRVAQVVTRMPGVAPERIEQLITRPVEERIKTIAEIKQISSISMTGLSLVTAEVRPQFQQMDPIWNRLRNKMDDLTAELPSGSDGPHVNDDYGRLSVVTLALTGDDYAMSELDELARQVRDQLNVLPLVASVDLFGVQQERVWIEFDAAFSAQFGVNPSMIINSLNSQNVILPGGHVEANGQDIVIEPSGDFQSIDDIRQVAIDIGAGQLVYLEDLATVRRAYVEPAQSPAFYNGQPAIVLGVSMVKKSNVVELGEQVTAELARITPQLPLGISLDVVIYQPDLVQASVNGAVVNLMQTVAVVLAVVMLFLGWQSGLIVGAMVPLTMFATLIGMSVWGIELHRISIAAIIVALGLLVDNGVVIVEQIRNQLDAGDSKLEASLAPVRALALPLLTSSFTTVAAFLPLMLIDGGSGEFLRSLGQVVMLALLSSWLIAITIVPAFCYWFLPDGPAVTTTNPVNPVHQGNQGTDSSPATSFYRKLLTTLLCHRLLFIALMIALLLSSVGVFSLVKQRSLGASERNQFTVYLDLPAAAAIDQTIAATQRLSAYLKDPEQNPEVTDLLAYVGAGGPRFFLALTPNDPQPNKAFLVVNTQQANQIETVMARVERYIIEQLPEANGRADLLFLGPAALGTVELKITGPDIKTLQRLSYQVTDAFRSVPEVQSIRNNWENSVMKLRVEIDQERARRAGVTSEEIAQTLSGYFDGASISAYREGDQVIPITVRAQSSDRMTLDQVRTVELYSSSRQVTVPLIQVANFRGEVEPSKIRRIDQQRALTIAGKHPQMTAVKLYQAMQPALNLIDLPSGYTLQVEGEIKGAEDNNADLFRYAPHALFIIVALLVLQFNSFRRTAIILLTIPLVIIGANYGLFLFNGYFDFTAMLGLFSLAGIIINNGIVMIDRIEQNRATGAGVNQSVIDAAVARARPIVMTTVTTMVGLIPLALFGGEFWYGMAIVIICGIAVGTLLTLGFVPVLYSLFFAGLGSDPKLADPAPA